MNESGSKKNGLTRRRFLGNTAAAATAIAIAPLTSGCVSKRIEIQTKPNVSNFGGVQIGSISYSWQRMTTYGPEEVLGYCIASGIGSLEARWIEIEAFAGIPEAPQRQPLPQNFTGMAEGSAASQAAGEGVPQGRGGELSEQQQQEFEAARAAALEAQRQWRISVPMTKFEEFRKMYNDAGVLIHCAKMRPANWSDEEIDYAFKVAKTLGARGVGEEISEEACHRLAPFAEKHNMNVYFHNHGQVGAPGFSFDDFLNISPMVMLNVDVGHFYGATGIDPTEILQQYHERIVSIHMKDKTGPNADPPNTNMPFGQGETPLIEVLQLIQREGWPINCDIELEYPIPEGSDAIAEVRKCVEYCRQALS